jgi:inorganic pyrophosphatase
MQLEGTKFDGDGDPLDAIDLAESNATVGQVKQVKVLGALCLIDCQEVDWKVITVDAQSPLAEKLNGTV